MVYTIIDFSLFFYPVSIFPIYLLIFSFSLFSASSSESHFYPFSQFNSLHPLLSSYCSSFTSTSSPPAFFSSTSSSTSSPTSSSISSSSPSFSFSFPFFFLISFLYLHLIPQRIWRISGPFLLP